MTRLDFYLHCSCNLNGVVVVGSGLIKDILVTLLLFFLSLCLRRSPGNLHHGLF